MAVNVEFYVECDLNPGKGLIAVYENSLQTEWDEHLDGLLSNLDSTGAIVITSSPETF
jgi:hypothetical protein